jgi:hypothetical protein
VKGRNWIPILVSPQRGRGRDVTPSLTLRANKEKAKNA